MGARMDSIQALRGIAAFSVVLFHVHWTGIASFGVELFFVLSGFIICHAATKEPEGFLIKRVCRVVPLYWIATFAVFVAATVMPSLFETTQPTLANLARSLFFIPFTRPDGTVMPLLFLGWTLNYEALFYLIFAGSLTLSRAAAPLIVAAVILALVASHPVLAPISEQLGFWTGPAMLDFLVGIAAYYGWTRLNPQIARVPAPVAVMISLVALAALIAGFPHGLSSLVPVKAMLGGILLLAALRLDGWLKWPPVLLLLGDASYSLYLLHPYVVEFVDRRVHPLGATDVGILWTLVVIGVAFGLAVISFRLVERPSNRLLRNYFSRSNLKPSVSAGV
jgi:exopolysaccharide production protein ExoZ